MKTKSTFDLPRIHSIFCAPLYQRTAALLFMAVFLFCPAAAQEAAPKTEIETKAPSSSLEEDVRHHESQALILSGENDTFEQYRVLIDLIDSVSRNYVHSISRKELIEAAIQGVTSKLDPYSYYIGNEEMKDFRREVHSNYGGVGMAIDSRGGKFIVVAPLAGMPAYTAGIHAGDELLEVAGEKVHEKKMDEVLQLLTGEIGTTVDVKVRRTGEKKPLDFTLRRELILMETVLGFDRSEDDSWNYWLDKQNGIAYIHVTEFRDGTGEELRKVLEMLQKPESEVENESETKNESTGSPQKENSRSESKNEDSQAERTDSGSPLNGLILDLRFNPGGSFQVSVAMADMFIEEGTLVSAKGKNTVEQIWRASPEVLIPQSVPVVILVNSYSASASEVFSACLQDHQRAVIAGERTFGKGVIQSVLPFEGGTTNLKLTTASYFSPNGRNIHKEEGMGENDEWGVKPDDEFLVQTSAEEDRMFLDDRSRRGTLKTHNDLPVTKNPADYRDTQLEKALEIVLKAQNIKESASQILKKRSAPYRKGGERTSTRRVWRR